MKYIHILHWGAHVIRPRAGHKPQLSRQYYLKVQANNSSKCLALSSAQTQNKNNKVNQKKKASVDDEISFFFILIKNGVVLKN